jgi:hypothetical protein
VSLFAPQRAPSWPANWLADLAAVAGGTYLPWQAGLLPAEWTRHARSRRAFRRRLAAIWSDRGWQAVLRPVASAPGLARLQATFLELASDLASAESHCRAANRLMAAVRPRVVVSFPALDKAGIAFAWAAHRHGSQVLGVQTGIISPVGLTNLAYRRDLTPQVAPRPDRLLVWGPYYADVLARFGWKEDELIVGGFPEDPRRPMPRSANTPIHQPERPRRLLILAASNLTACSTVVEPPDGSAWVARLLAAVRAVAVRGRPLAAVVRCHPGAAGSPYAAQLERLVATCPGACFDDGREPLAAVLQRADAVVGAPSTSLIEAARVGKPVGVIAPAGLDVTGFGALGLPVISPGDDLAPVLARLCAGAPADEECRQRFVAAVAPAVPSPSPLRAAIAQAMTSAPRATHDQPALAG